MPALQKKHKKSSVHNIKSVMNTRHAAGSGNAEQLAEMNDAIDRFI